jgi:hypothetical protein
VTASEIRNVLANAQLDAGLKAELDALVAGGAELSDAELEAVVGGKTMTGFGGGFGGFGGLGRRGGTGFGSANRAIASMSRSSSNNIRRMTNSFTRSVLRR